MKTDVPQTESLLTLDVLHKLFSRSVLHSLAAGGIAGAVAKTTIAPLDRAKINFQVSQGRFSYAAALRFLVNSYKQYGFTSLWRGNSATMVRIVPYAALQFGSHEYYRQLFVFRSMRTYPTDPNVHVHLPMTERFAAGAMAGMTAACFVYPLDFVRCRMAVTSREHYRSIGSTMKAVHRSEGLRAFYRGYSATLVGQIPYAGVAFFIYESFKKHYSTNGEKFNGVRRLVCGGISGLCGQICSYPFDVARRRMQSADVVAAVQDRHHYRSLFSTLKFVSQSEGLRGLYKGLSMNFIKAPIANSIAFFLHDTIKELLR